MSYRSKVLTFLGIVAIAACSSSKGTYKVVIGGESGGATGTAGSGNGTAGAGVDGTFILGTNTNGQSTGNGDENLIINGVCDQQPFNLVRKPPQILLLLDRSASMKEDINGTNNAPLPDQKWTYVVPGVTAAIQATDNDVQWGLKLFPEGTGNECLPSSLTPGAAVPVAPMNASAVVAGIPATFEGDGTFIAFAINAAVAYLSGLGTDNSKYILLATDGAPSCDASFQKDSTQARVDAIAACRRQR